VRDSLGWAWRETEMRLWWEVRTCWARERPKPAEVPVTSQVGEVVDIVVAGFCLMLDRGEYGCGFVGET